MLVYIALIITIFSNVVTSTSTEYDALKENWGFSGHTQFPIHSKRCDKSASDWFDGCTKSEVESYVLSKFVGKNTVTQTLRLYTVHHATSSSDALQQFLSLVLDTNALDSELNFPFLFEPRELPIREAFKYFYDGTVSVRKYEDDDGDLDDFYMVIALFRPGYLEEYESLKYCNTKLPAYNTELVKLAQNFAESQSLVDTETLGNFKATCTEDAGFKAILIQGNMLETGSKFTPRAALQKCIAVLSEIDDWSALASSPGNNSQFPDKDNLAGMLTNAQGGGAHVVSRNCTQNLILTSGSAISKIHSFCVYFRLGKIEETS